MGALAGGRGSGAGPRAYTAKALSAGMREAGVKRLFVVGVACGLEVAPGVQLIDSPEFPEAWKAIALAHARAWGEARETSERWGSAGV